MNRENEFADLLEKYMAAETSLEEESRLKKMVLNEEEPDLPEDIHALFGYFDLQRYHTKIPEFENPAVEEIKIGKRTRIIPMSWITAAASVLILVAAYFYINPTSPKFPDDTFTDPYAAAQNAARALHLLSAELNNGMTLTQDQIKDLNIINNFNFLNLQNN